MKKIVVFTAALLISVPALASGEDNLSLAYTLYAGGLKVVNIGVTYHLGSQSYDIHANAQTTGMWKSLVPWRNIITARGTVDADGVVHPQLAKYDDVWREKLRTAEFSFENGIASAVATPPHKQDGRVEATEEQRKGAMDPLSAVVNVLSQGGAKGCQGSIPAFDGRRLYNLVFANKGVENVAANRYSMFAGSALRCEVLFEPVAGFPRRDEHSGFWSAQDNAKAANPLIIWIARPSPDMPEMPVRIQSTVKLGTIVAHLRTINTVPETAQLP